MQPISGNQRPDLLTSLMNMNMSLIPRLPRKMYLCRSSSNGDACFLGLGTFFWTCTCFLVLAGIILGPRVAKNVGDLLVCFLDPVFFFDLHVFVLDPGIVFSTTKLIVSELGFCFWTRAPASWTLPPEGGGNSIVIGARIGLDFFGPWRILFWHPYAFFWTWHRVGGS